MHRHPARPPAPAGRGTPRTPTARPGSATAHSSPARRCRTRRTAPPRPPRAGRCRRRSMLALLPPSSRVQRFTWSAQPAMIFLPTAVEPVKPTLRTSGWVTKRSPTTDPAPGMIVSTPSGIPASQRELTDPDRGQRGQLGGLHDHRVAGGQRGRHPPGQDRHREVPRHDDADHAERLVEGHVEAAGHRDLPAEHPLRGGRVVVQAVPDVAGLPGRVAPGVARVADLELGELLDVVVDDGREAAQQPGPLPRRDVAPGGEGGVRALDQRVGLRHRGQRHVGDGLLGRGVDHGVQGPGRHTRLTSSRSRAAAPSRSPRRRTRSAPRRPCSCSGPPPRRPGPTAPPRRR